MLIVLLLISTVMSAAYAVLHSQLTNLEIQENSARRHDARQAAAAGIAAALQKMHRSSWEGIDAPIEGSLDENTTYVVRLSTGDPRVSSTHPEFGLSPYRVTLVSTGTCHDPLRDGRATHRIRVVAQLVPRNLGEGPVGWTSATTYTVYQLDSEDVFLELPLRIEGPVKLRGRLHFGEEYDWNSSVCDRYLTDLNRMRTSGLPDYRPFTGPLELGAWIQDPQTLYRLLLLGIDTKPAGSAPDWSFPSALEYELYPGGKQYRAETCPRVLENRTLEPDPTTNPLGVFVSSGDVDIRDGVVLRGTLLSQGNVRLLGEKIDLSPAPLPSLEGSPKVVQAPVLVARNGLVLGDGCQATMRGVALAWKVFRAHEGDADRALDFQGTLITEEMELDGLRDWDRLQQDDWRRLYTDFSLRLLNPLLTRNENRFFPLYCEHYAGLVAAPQLKFKLPQQPALCYWPDGQPVYRPERSDRGLKWEILDWAEGLAM